MSDTAISDEELATRIQASFDAMGKLSTAKRYVMSYTYLNIKWVDPSPVWIKLVDIGYGPRRKISKTGINVLLASISAGARLLGSEEDQTKFLRKGTFLFSVLFFVLSFVDFLMLPKKGFCQTSFSLCNGLEMENMFALMAIIA